MNKICVVGSMNVDMTFTVSHFHAPGESVIADSLAIYTGGKGGNQTVAVARLGADVSMIGCVGNDSNGQMYIDTLKREGVSVDAIVKKDNVPTGVAAIEVGPGGENRIVVALGANYAMDTDDVTAKAQYLSDADVCMFQLENPMVVVNHAMALAKQAGKVIVLDPAPVPSEPVSDAIFILCDYVTPNETELQILSGMPVDTIEQAVTAAQVLLNKGVKAVINKRGGDGALLVTKEGYKHYPGFKVNVIDTTAAGDSFNAGLCVGLAKGMVIDDAIVLANAVGALSTTAQGAQAAMPGMKAALSLVATSTM